ncbi:MAG: radical SAM protein [Desulfobacterales bacterium]|nr:radical SAM protein [Desulfobacterales bacterium]
MKSLMDKPCSRRHLLKGTVRLCVNVGLSSILLDNFLGSARCRAATSDDRPGAKQAPGFEPAYLERHRSGELGRRAEELWALMEACELCPRSCGVNRLEGEKGFCQAPGADLVVSAFQPHFGEERPLVGRGGSGTIFLTHCNLRCVFCQNWEISQLGRGAQRGIEDLAQMMLKLQAFGCHNLNFVTPTHYAAHILKALDIAAADGLRLPIVYNTSGWERADIIALLDGIVDIYLPDFKYWEGDLSAKYSAGAESYPDLTRMAIREMHRQVGVAKPDAKGLIRRGLMIRHLVMPNNTGGSEEIMAWIAETLPKDTYVNIMAQYHPSYKAFDYRELSRRITGDEYRRVVKRAKQLGLSNLDIQGYQWLR